MKAKKILIFTYFFLLFPMLGNLSFGNITNYLSKSDFMLYFPNYSSFLNSYNTILKTQYENNLNKISTMIQAVSKEQFGFDFSNEKDLQKVGISITKPFAILSSSNKYSYLLLPLKDKKAFLSYMGDKVYSFSYKILANEYVAISQNKEILNHIDNSLFVDPNYQIAVSNLKFSYKEPFVFLTGKYLLSFSSLTLLPFFVAPDSYYAFKFNFDETLQKEFGNLNVQFFEGFQNTTKEHFLDSIYNVSYFQNVEFLNYIPNGYSFIQHTYLNIPSWFKIQKQTNLLFQEFLKYYVNDLSEKEFNTMITSLSRATDGRFKIASYHYDKKTHSYKMIMSLGVRNRTGAKQVIEDLNYLFGLKGNVPDFQDLFTNLFYISKQNDTNTLYYGLFDQELIFATDYDLLYETMKNIHEERMLRNIPNSFEKKMNTKQKGSFRFVDMTSLFLNMEHPIYKQLYGSWITSTLKINMSSYPILDKNKVGILSEVDINFIK